MDSKTGFSSRVQQALAAKGITQAELSREIGVKPQLTHSYLNGSIPEPDNLVRLAQALDVTIDFLFTGRQYTNVEAVPILGQIPAGPLAEARETREGDVDVPAALLPRGGQYFALRVIGDSMLGAGVPAGSLAIIRVQPRVANGEIAAVIVDGDAGLKYFYAYPDCVILKPGNPCYPYSLIPRSRNAEIRVAGRLILAVTAFPPAPK